MENALIKRKELLEYLEAERDFYKEEIKHKGPLLQENLHFYNAYVQIIKQVKNWFPQSADKQTQSEDNLYRHYGKYK